MNTNKNGALLRGVAAAALIVAAAIPVRAQDTGQATRGVRADRTAMAATQVERLTRGLELNEGQKTAVLDAITESAPDGRATTRWAVAAELQRQLNPEQKEKLLQMGRTAAIYGEGVRAGMSRANRNGRAQRTQRQQRMTANRGTMARAQARSGHEDMVQALGLNREQIELFEIHRALGAVSSGRAVARAAQRGYNGANRPARRPAARR